MKLLLDSNILIRLTYKPNAIGPAASRAIENAEEVCASVVSLWELTIKFLKGTLPHNPADIAAHLNENGIRIMHLESAHVVAFKEVKLPQKDPFDRMLVAQAVALGSIFVTTDRQILNSKYPSLDGRTS